MINPALLVLSAYMTGVIWVVQLLVYPNFKRYDESIFLTSMNHHTRNISLIVMIPMLLELALSVWWIYTQADLNSYVHGLLLAGIWFSTFLIQVPCHNKLSTGKDTQVIEKLVRTNWIRTVLWSLKTGLLLFISAQNSSF